MNSYIPGPLDLAFSTPARLSTAWFRMFFLPARTSVLERFIQRRLHPAGSPHVFRLLDPVSPVTLVLVALVDIEEARARGCPGWTPERDLAFFAPVRSGASVLWHPLVLLVDQPHGVAMGREIYGLPKTSASFHLPAAQDMGPMEVRTWGPISPDGEWRPDRLVLSLQPTSVGKAVAPLVDLVQDATHHLLQSPVSQKLKLPELGQELLDGVDLDEIRVVTLKQFRDAADPARACYQSLVVTPFHLNLPSPLPVDPVPYRLKVGEAFEPLEEALGIQPVPVVETRTACCTFDLELGREIWRATEDLGADVHTD